MFNSIAAFESDLDQFDKQLSNIITPGRTSPLNNKVGQPSSDNKNMSPPCVKKDNLKYLMKEIDNEFDELDSLLRDIDTIKFGDNDEEHMSNAPSD